MKDLVFEIIGIDRASHTLEKVGGAIEANSRKLTGMQRAGSMAGKALVVGLAGVVAGGYESVKAATEEQAAQAKLAKQLENTTGATGEQIEAANEWIEKQAEAKGVAVDQLEPALAKLATSTGDLGKAQDELSTAMDASAGSGKSLDMVATALVKVNNGSATGLAKLGVTTKSTAKDTDALKAAQIGVHSAQLAVTKAVKDNGVHSQAASLATEKLHLAQSKLKDAQDKTKTSTISASDAMDQLAKKYGGDAADAAQTNAGKTKVLGVEIHDLMVKIGTGLIPAVEHLTDAGLKMVDWVSKNGPLVEDLAIGLGTLLATTWAVGKATAAWGVISEAAAAAGQLFAASATEVDVAMDANPIGLVVLAIAALVAGFILAYKHSETFRTIVNATFGFLGKYVPEVIGKVIGFVKDHWGLIVSIIGGPIGIVVVQVIKHWDTVKAMTLAMASYVVDKAKDFGKFASAVIDKVDDVVSFFKKLPGKITGFIDDLPGDLQTLGGDMVQGLVDGLSAAWHKVTDFVEAGIKKIPKKIRDLMGISSPSKVTFELGQFIGDGLADGISAKEGKVSDAAKKLADKVKTHLANLQEAFDSTKSGVASHFAGDMFSASAQAAVYQHNDEVRDADGNVVTPASDTLVTPAQTVGQNLISNLSSSAGSLGQLLPAFKQLRKWGWKPQMLAALFQSGGPDLIIELGSNQGEASEALGLMGQIGHLSNMLGGQVADNEYGDQIDALKHKGKKGKGGKDGSDRESSDRTGDVYQITFHVPPNADTNGIARTTVQMLKKYKREVNGGGELGLA